MTIPILYTPINNAKTTLTASHAVSDGILSVLNASEFGFPTPINPVRVTCVRASDSNSVIFSVTGSDLFTNRLFISNAIEGTTDITLAVGDQVLGRITAGFITDIYTYLSNCLTSVTLTGNITGTGTSSISTTIASGVVTNAMLAGNVSSSKLIGTDITTLGTVTVGTWNATAIAATYLPTLNSISLPTGNLDLNNHKIVNLLDPTGSQDAATKNYVDANSGGGGGGGLTGVTLVSSGLLHNSPVNASVSGGIATLTQTLVNQTAHTFLAGPTTGSAAAPTMRLIVIGDLPNIPLSVSNVDGSLTVSPTYGNVVASLNVANANTWSALQTFTGGVSMNSHYGTITTDTDASTITFNMATSDWHQVQIAGNRTLAVSNVTVGQQFTIIIQQDSTGSRTISSWFSGILWSGGTAPTLTTTANKRDVFTFKCISSGVFLGFTPGTNF